MSSAMMAASRNMMGKGSSTRSSIMLLEYVETPLVKYRPWPRLTSILSAKSVIKLPPIPWRLRSMDK